MIVVQLNGIEMETYNLGFLKGFTIEVSEGDTKRLKSFSK
jgi:hypothetical protein